MNGNDPRVKRTRKMLMEAFISLLGEQRFSDISVQDIAERATVNRATFYAHFVDKYALLDEAFSEMFREQVTDHLPPSAPFTAERLSALILTLIQGQAAFYDHCQHQSPGRDIAPLMEAKIQQELYAYLLEWLRMSPLADSRRDGSREVAASAMSWAIFGAAVEWARGEREASAEERARQVAETLMGGVAQTVQAEAPA